MYCILSTNRWTKHKHLYPVVYNTLEEAQDWVKSRSAFHKWNNELEIKLLTKIE
jgi:hypothetical protein